MAPVLVLALTTSAITFLAYLLWRRRNGGSNRLPPGPWGVPFLGYLPFLGSELHRSFATLAQSFGPVMSLRLGTELCVVISSPSSAKEVLHDRDTVFANHHAPIAAVITSYGGNDMAWAPHGPHWRMIRKLSVLELLRTAKIDSFQGLRQREVGRLIGGLRSRAGEAVNVREMLQRMMLNLILGMLWDAALEGDEEEDHGSSVAIELQRVVHGILELWGAPNISDFIHVLAPFDLQGVQRRSRELFSRFDTLMDSILNERYRANEADEGGRGKRKDFLQVILDIADKGDSEESPLNLNHVKGLLLDMIAAGMDTTATAIEWVLSQLLHNPDVMEKVQQELDVVVGRDAVVEESRIYQLHYLDAVVKETMRLYPPGPLLIPYRPSSSCNVGGYTIPQGTKVFVNVWAIQRDPSVWENPLEFKPERFLTGKGSKRDYYGKSFDFLPFGSGRRVCVGTGLAERTVMYVLSSLLHALALRPLEGVKSADDVEDKFGIVLRKREPLVAVPISKSGNQ